MRLRVEEDSSSTLCTILSLPPTKQARKGLEIVLERVATLRLATASAGNLGTDAHDRVATHRFQRTMTREDVGLGLAATAFGLAGLGFTAALGLSLAVSRLGLATARLGLATAALRLATT